MEENTLMSNLLRQACMECVADAGKEDDALVERLHDYMHENYEAKGEPWNYEMIDELIKKWTERVEFRDLDGVYFRINRNDKWQNICFSDLTEEEMVGVLEGRDEQWLKSLCKILGNTLRDIGDQLDITRNAREEEEE